VSTLAATKSNQFCVSDDTTEPPLDDAGTHCAFCVNTGDARFGLCNRRRREDVYQHRSDYCSFVSRILPPYIRKAVNIFQAELIVDFQSMSVTVINSRER
jgi:hypothetical protein